VSHEKNSSKQEDPLLYELEFTAKKPSPLAYEKIELKIRNKTFKEMQMPELPEPPSTSVTVE